MDEFWEDENIDSMIERGILDADEVFYGRRVPKCRKNRRTRYPVSFDDY